MKVHRRIFALILAALVCAGCPGGLRAAAFGFGFPGGGEEGGEETKTILSVGSPDPLATELLFLDPGSDDWAEGLQERLPSTEPCRVQGSWALYFCPVTWNTEALDAEQPGRQVVSGTLEPAAEYTFADGVSSAVSYPVYFTGGTTETETLDSWNVDALNSTDLAVLGVNGDPSSLELWNYEAQCLTANNGGSFSCPLNWDFSAVNLAVPGVYTATATVTLPDGFAAPADAQPITAVVGVVDPDAIDLSAHHITEYGNLECDYLCQTDLSAVTVEYALGDGDWTEDPAVSSSGHLRGQYFEMGNGFVIFFLNRLELQTDYHFRILYGDGLVSNEITIRLEAQGSSQPIVTMGGNRDGSQSDPLPDLVQPLPDDGDDPGSADWFPAPKPEPDAAQEAVPTPQADPVAPDESDGLLTGGSPAAAEETPAAPASPAVPAGLSAATPDPINASPEPDAEVVTDTYTILSGLRMHELLRSGSRESILFEKGGVAVELPCAFLAGLALGDTDLFKVTVEQPAADSFRLDVAAAGQELSQLSATTVRLHWDGQQNHLECVDAAKTHVSDASYDAGTQTVSCTVYAPGTYSIRPVPETGTPTPLTASTADSTDSVGDSVTAGQTSDRLPVILAAAAVGGAAALLALRRRHE